MAYPFTCPEWQALSALEAFEVHHWPIVRSYAERLGLVEVINRLVPTEMEVAPGTIVLGLVIDTLSGRNPLYHLESFFEAQDRALLLGCEVEAKAFNDDTVGRVLDRLYECGTQKIFSELSLRAVESFGLPLNQVHHDTTSVRLYGDYAPTPGVKPAFEITYGHSKDHRPDLKQLVLSLLCVGGNVPILGQVHDGNASDKTINNDLLSEISGYLARYGVEPGAFIYIADAALVTPRNLKRMGTDVLFISRLPANYAEHRRVIGEAVAANQWQALGHLTDGAPSRQRPPAQYKIHETSVTLYEQTYRAVVVHSSSHDRRCQKRLARQLETSETQQQNRAKALSSARYVCEADARTTATQAQQSRSAYHYLDVEVIPAPCYGPGRPRSDGTRPVKRTEYRLQTTLCADEAAIEAARLQAGCFVLLSNVPTDGDVGTNAEQLLRRYKEQQGIEKNFGFLKDDAIVNALFLKTPQRLEALGLILLIALLIWRLLEYAMRQHLNDTQTKLPGWDNKPTNRPTAYMLTIKFKSLLILKHGAERILARPLSNAQRAFLFALGLDERIFTDPAIRPP